MQIVMTAQRKNGECHLFADVTPDSSNPGDLCLTANPVEFRQTSLFATDGGSPMLVLPLEEAKKMAREILKL